MSNLAMPVPPMDIPPPPPQGMAPPPMTPPIQPPAPQIIPVPIPVPTTAIKPKPVSKKVNMTPKEISQAQASYGQVNTQAQAGQGVGMAPLKPGWGGG